MKDGGSIYIVDIWEVIYGISLDAMAFDETRSKVKWLKWHKKEVMKSLQGCDHFSQGVDIATVFHFIISPECLSGKASFSTDTS